MKLMSRGRLSRDFIGMPRRTRSKTDERHPRALSDGVQIEELFVLEGSSLGDFQDHGQGKNPNPKLSSFMGMLAGPSTRTPTTAVRTCGRRDQTSAEHRGHFSACLETLQDSKHRGARSSLNFAGAETEASMN